MTNSTVSAVAAVAVFAGSLSAIGAATQSNRPPSGHTPAPPFLVARGPGKTDVSLNVNRAPINTVLPLLFRRNDQSYVLGSHVTGTVTASLHDVPFDTALDQILAANSVPLVKTMQGDVYVIKSRSQPQSPDTSGRAGARGGNPYIRRRYRNYRSQ